MLDSETLKLLVGIFVLIVLGVASVLIRRVITSRTDQTTTTSLRLAPSKPLVLTIEVASLVKMFLRPSDPASSYVLVDDEDVSDGNYDWEEDLADLASFDEEVGKNIRIMLPSGITGQNLLQQLEKLEPSSRSGKTYKVVFYDQDDSFELGSIEETDVIVKE